MNRRTFLQIAGGMVVGAIVGGNGPNPVNIPNRPRVTPTPYTMPSQQAYEMGKSMVDGFMGGIKQGSSVSWKAEIEFFVIDGNEHKRITHKEFCDGFMCGDEPTYWPTSIDPTTTAEYDQEWEEM